MYQYLNLNPYNNLVLQLAYKIMQLAPLYRYFQNKTRAKRINSFGLMVCEKNTTQVLVQNQIKRITVQTQLFKPDKGPT